MIPLRKSSSIAFSLSLILLILTYIASQWLILKIEKDNFVQEMQANTKEHLSFAKTLFDSVVTDLQFTVTALQNCESIWQPEAKEILKLSHRLNFCDATFISDMSGDAIAHTGEVFSIAKQDFFQDALQSPGLTFSDILPSQRYGAIQIISLPIFARVHGQQEPVGYLFGLYDVKRFSRTIDARHDSGKYIYIVDSHGTYINSFSENQDLSGDRNFWDDFALVNMEGTTIEEMEKNFHAEAEGDFSYSHGDVRRYGYHMPLGIKDWQIVLSIDESIVDSRVETLSTVATTATIINWICLGVMLWCISSYFISANQKMRKINQDISKNHEMIKIATESSNRVIFEYSIPYKRIEFKTSFTHPLFHDSVLFRIPERLIQMHAVEKDSVPALRDLFRRIEHENSCQADVQVVWSADEMIWCRITLQNLYGENGDIISTVGCIENIDMLKQGEEAIKRKLEIHKSLIKNSLLYGRLNLSSGMIVELNGSNVSISYADYLSQHASRYVCIEYLSYVMQSLSLELPAGSISPGQGVSGGAV